MSREYLSYQTGSYANKIISIMKYQEKKTKNFGKNRKWTNNKISNLHFLFLDALLVCSALGTKRIAAIHIKVSRDVRMFFLLKT